MSPAARVRVGAVPAAVLLMAAACAGTVSQSASAEPRSLAGLWAFQPGDDPAWAEPGFDDRSWTRLRVPGSWRRPGYNYLSGIAWYRLRVPPVWPGQETLGLTLGRIDSAYELYAGGQRLGGVGALPPRPRIAYDRHHIYALPPGVRQPDGSLVLALRVWRAPQFFSMAAGPIDGPFEIGPLSDLLDRARLAEALDLALVLVFLLVAVGCLAPRGRAGSARDHTWFGILALLAVVYGFLRTQSRDLVLDDFVVLTKIEHGVLWAAPAAILQFLWAFFRQPHPGWLRPVQIAFVAIASVILLTPGLAVPLALAPVLQISVVPLLVVSMGLVVRRLHAGDREARIMGVGIVLLGATIVHDVLVERDVLAAPQAALYGFAALVAGMMATLGRRFQNALRDRDALTHEFEDRVAVRTRELSTAYREMEERALWDGLTQILSRQAIRDRAESELARARRYRTPFALAIIDIDHFKSVNDTRGHAAGDSVLVEITKRLVQAVRASDDVGRWGGDEFVVLMPATDVREAAKVGERLRSLVAATPATLGNDAVQTMTVSVGVTAVDATAAESLDFETLVARADEALYRAKADGRNRVSVGEIGAASAGQSELEL